MGLELTDSAGVLTGVRGPVSTPPVLGFQAESQAFTWMLGSQIQILYLPLCSEHFIN